MNGKVILWELCFVLEYGKLSKEALMIIIYQAITKNIIILYFVCVDNLTFEVKSGFEQICVGNECVCVCMYTCH